MVNRAGRARLSFKHGVGMRSSLASALTLIPRGFTTSSKIVLEGCVSTTQIFCRHRPLLVIVNDLNIVSISGLYH